MSRRLLILATAALLGGCSSELLSPRQLSNADAAARPALSPATLTATTVSWSRIDLAWQDNANNESGWEIHQSATPDGQYGQAAEVGPNVTSYSATGLNGSSQHCYKVRSYTRKGPKTTFGSFSNVACATTQPPPVPDAPSGLSARPESNSNVLITWVDNSTNESGFRLEYSYDGGTTWAVDGSDSPPNATARTHYPPMSGATEQLVCYRVIAFNDFGSSTSTADCTAIPWYPTNLVATGVAGPAVNLGWTDRSSVEDGYELRRAGPDGVSIVIATLGANAVSYRDASIATDIRYTYSLRAMRDGGASGAVSAEVMVAGVAPVAPSDLAAHPSSSTSIGLGWTTQSANHDGFRIERSLDGGSTWLVIGSQDRLATSSHDPDVPSETRACYRVFAVNDAGSSPPSNTACTTAPAAPTGLDSPAQTSTSIDLSWTDNSSSEDGFQIHELYEDCSYYYGCVQYWVAVATVGANVTTFRHEGLSPGSVHTYLVLALKDGGNSSSSNAVAVATSSGNQ